MSGGISMYNTECRLIVFFELSKCPVTNNPPVTVFAFQMCSPDGKVPVTLPRGHLALPPLLRILLFSCLLFPVEVYNNPWLEEGKNREEITKRIISVDSCK